MSAEEEQKSHDTETLCDAKPAAVKQTYNHIPADHGLFGVHVSGFTCEVTENYLRELFTAVGKVHVCKVVSSKKNQDAVADDKKSYVAFVKFKVEQEALQAIDKFDGHQAKSCTLCVRPAYQSARFMARRDGGHLEEQGHNAQAHGRDIKQGTFEKQTREMSRQSSFSSLSSDTKRETNEQPDGRTGADFQSMDSQLNSPLTESICTTADDSEVVRPCQENGGNGYSSDQSGNTQHIPSSSNPSNSNEESKYQQLQENGFREDSHGESLPQSAESVGPVTNNQQHNQDNGSGRASRSTLSPHIQKNHPGNERGQRVENQSGKDSSGQPVSLHQNYSKPGRHQNWRQQSPRSGNTGNKGKEFQKQSANPRWESSPSRQCSGYPTADGAQPVTDYRLREGLLDKEHVANFNSTPSDEKLRSNTGIGEARRGEQGFQQGPAQLQTSSPYVRSQQPTAPLTATTGLLYVDPNTQTRPQAHVPGYISSSYNYSQGQTAASESYPYYQSEALQRHGGQNVLPSNSVSSKPNASYSSALHHSVPSSFAPYPQMQNGFASGFNHDTVTPLNSAMSQLTIPRSIPSSSSAQSSKDLSLWSPQEVADYVRGTECSNQASFFVEQDIDGQALLLLETGLLLHFMKAGPALKLLQVIDRLRKCRATSPGLHDQKGGINGW